MADFEFLRLSLAQVEQASLFGSEGEPFRELSRAEYLAVLFAQERVDFQHYGSAYTFTRELVEGNIVVGRIGKPASDVKHEGPDEGWALKERDFWRTVWVFIDVSPSSQQIAVQKGLASPLNLMRSFFARMEETHPGYQYRSFIEYVSDKQEFWTAVEQNAGKITKLEFTFVPPNALGAAKIIRGIIDDASKEIGAQKTKISHTNKDGNLRPAGDYVEKSLEIAAEGAGSVEMKVGRKTVFSSSRNRKTQEVPESEIPEVKDEKGLLALARRLFGL